MPFRSLRTMPARLGPLLLAALALLCGCAPLPTVDSTAAVRQLLHDGLYPGAPVPPGPQQTFVMSDAMKRFADRQLAEQRTAHDPRRALIDALRADGQLRLDYDDGYTGNAAEAFAKRTGNCLSLVIMTAAFAKHLDLPLRFQSVEVGPQYRRSDGLTLSSGHVNLVLSNLPTSQRLQRAGATELTVDFVAPELLRRYPVRILSEDTVQAMYMNNRAVESLTAGDLPAAYAWARQGLLVDADYLPGVNTLAVVYLRSGQLAAAEQALRHVLAREPDDVPGLTNLAATLHQAGRTDEAQAVARRLASVQANAPFHFLDLGRQALAAGQPETARELIRRELRRQPYQPEVHFWAAVADLALGDRASAEGHLREAVDNSDSRAQQARYSAKLAALRAPPSQP